MKKCDIVIEVLDSRDIEGTTLKTVEKWAGRRLLRVANKTDLAPKSTLKELESLGVFLLNCKSANLNAERKRVIEFILSKTAQRPLRVMVVGYPNVGKSTMINMLAQRRAARATSVAGTTTNIQWIRISEDILLLDSPGVFSKEENKESLVKKGAINVSSLKNPEFHAYKLAQKCLSDSVLRKWVSEYFDLILDESDAPEKLIEKIAERRKWLLKGGELNTLEASKALLRAFMEAPKH